MKKLCLFALIILIYSGCAFAIGAGIGVRSAAMGGTGIAIANDVVSSAYFNPACLMGDTDNVDVQLEAGGATEGISEISDILSAANDSDTLISNLLPKGFNVNASLSGGLGVSVKKVGISLLATGYTNFSKVADSLNMNINGQVRAVVPLTLGSTFSTPGLPIASMSVGVNLKSINDLGVLTSLSSTGGTATGIRASSIGTGFGFDIGAVAKITPLISVGGVIRNLSASETVISKSTSLTTTIEGGNPVVTDGPETDSTSTITPAPETGIGIGVVIPITGTLVACDLENYSFPDSGDSNKSDSFTDTHIGVEQGVLFNSIMLRAGYFTYGAADDTFYTYGIGLNAGPASIGLAACNSVKDSNNSIAMAQLGAAF